MSSCVLELGSWTSLLQEQGILETYHGIVKQEMPFSEVLESAYGLLEEFPSEVLVMSIKEKAVIGPSKCRSLSRLKPSSPRSRALVPRQCNSVA